MIREVKARERLVIEDKNIGAVGSILTVTKPDAEGFYAKDDLGRVMYFFYSRELEEGLSYAGEPNDVEAQISVLKAEFCALNYGTDDDNNAYREKLAEKIYLAALVSENRIYPQYAFKAADAFIEERDRQRKAAIQKAEESEA